MENQTKSKVPLFIGIGIPLLLAFFVFLVDFFLPSIFIKPQYNFIYATGYEFRYLNIQKEGVNIPPCPYSEIEIQRCQFYPDINFYLYDMGDQESIPLSLAEVNSYSLDISEKSPDGYFLYGGEREGGFFPFFWSSGNQNTFRLVKGSFLAKRVILKGDYYNFKFIAWVLNGEQ